MTTITLQYISGGTTYTRNYNIWALRGFDEPDECIIIGVQNRYLNGSVDENILGFRRVVTVDFGVLQDHTDKEFLSRFLSATDREIQYGGFFLNVALEDPAMFSNRWEEGLRIGKRFIVRFIGEDIETIFTLGAGYGFDYGTGYGTGL